MRILRAGTSSVLVLLLVLQTACYSALGPPQPVHPDDNDQMSTLRDASRVEVVLIDGNTQRLRGVVVGNQRLEGLDEESRVTHIPLDSIQTVQAYVGGSEVIFLGLVGGAFGLALLAGSLWMLSNLPK